MADIYTWKTCSDKTCWHLRTQQYNAMIRDYGTYAEAWFSLRGVPPRCTHRFLTYVKPDDAPKDGWIVRHWECLHPLEDAKAYIKRSMSL